MAAGRPGLGESILTMLMLTLPFFGFCFCCSLSIEKRALPVNSVPGSARADMVKAEPRRETAHGVAWPWGRSRSAFLLNHETTVSQKIAAEAPSLLTLKQAAHDLAVCRRTLERLIARGEFPRPVKIAGASRILATDVIAYVQKLTEQRSRP